MTASVFWRIDHPVHWFGGTMGGTNSADDYVMEPYKKLVTQDGGRVVPIFEVNVAGVCDDDHMLEENRVARVEKFTLRSSGAGI